MLEDRHYTMIMNDEEVQTIEFGAFESDNEMVVSVWTKGSGSHKSIDHFYIDYHAFREFAFALFDRDDWRAAKVYNPLSLECTYKRIG